MISFISDEILSHCKRWPTLGLGLSGGELLEIRLLDNHLLNTFGSKSTARHEIDQLLESS
jgi:hypothetical protein